MKRDACNGYGESLVSGSFHGVKQPQVGEEGPDDGGGGFFDRVHGILSRGSLNWLDVRISQQAKVQDTRVWAWTVRNTFASSLACVPASSSRRGCMVLC